ncbi:MAG: Glu/Leu/Phe/Val dehydrogenase [Patescibacteria group bacterium]|nr:Glu/Leu/Phe/Val dehydrogenase [Patescibacteria group bacterium]MBU1877060.1 Glu/Leu/Phe/Val dehydrogenase [Patescibacteria group bacterium]
MAQIKKIGDQTKPEYIIEVYDNKIGMEGFLVIDNTVLGPGKGGIRMTSDVTVEEVARLAKIMTWKNALAGIPFGGAKAGIKWKGGSNNLKKQFIQSFARAIKPFLLKKYIAAPDINTGEKEMQWFVEATGMFRSATGKPANICMEYKKCKKCGIPHEFGSTGFGVVQAAKVAAKIIGLDIKNATVSIHGFGNVGTFAYKFLTEMGAKVVALADKNTSIYLKDSLEEEIIKKLIKNKKDLSHYSGKAKKIKPEDFWKIPVDIMIPASVTDVINDNNKKYIKAKIIVEAANIPMEERVEDELLSKGILIVPDCIANAGGVISSYSEHCGHNIKKMFNTVEKKIKKTTEIVLQESLRKKRNPRHIAMEIAKKKIQTNANKKSRV